MASLKPTARKFVRAAFAHLEQKVPEKHAEPDLMPNWESAGGGLFVLRPRLRSPEEWCLIDEAPQFQMFPGSSALDAALESDSRIAPFLGQLVGTPLMSRQLDAEGLKRELLWTVFRSTGSFRFAEDAFSSGYGTWLADATARMAPWVFLAPLSLKFDGHLDLGEGTVLTRMDDDEVSACLRAGAISTLFPVSGDSAVVRSRTAIRLTYSLPRGLADDFTDDDRTHALELGNAASEVADEVVQALRVYKRGRVVIVGRVALLGGGAINFFPGAGPLQFTETEGLALAPDEAQSFRSFLDLFRTARKNRALGAVTRRFSYAGERTRRDDEIVDLIAALEALLLSEIPDRGELGFRTALRGALFIDGSGLTRRKIKRQLGRGYRVRSAVAHGAEPSPKDLKSPSGDDVTLDEFVAGIEELARLAVRKAIEAVGAGARWPPDWDGLALEQQTYP